MIGKTIAHYKILEKIGEGGMGVVYKAEDTKLKRTVALKFLPPELTRDAQAKARFVQEAQAAAALDHPNICAVHEIGEAEGSTYIVMPFVKGRSLKERIAGGPLSIDEAVAIASQVTEGLKEAHERGIIHRDIKPANIMLTEKGQAKIMDFGLAKLEAGVDLTRTMAVIGTAAYMSPEQARGEEVDLRTDIWSFGATLYEMLTGQKPFGQKHDQALIYSILNDATGTASQVRPEIPKPLDRVIQKAMEKDRARRYQSMGELLKDLKSIGLSGVSVPKADKSIIVLPFEDISPGKDNEYFSDGLTEEIITDLSHVHDLLVISRSSAMTFKGTKKTIPEIAHAVNARYVLEGSVRKAGNNLRITAQLIDAVTDAHLWAEKYTGTLNDIFDIQEKVSRSIVDVLRLKLTPEEKQKIAMSPMPDFYAYECYLKARYEIWKWTEEGLNNALIHLQKGLDIAGDNAVLLAGIGYTYFQYINTGVKADEPTMQKAEEYAKRALELDPEWPIAHVVRGLLLGWRGHPEESIKHFKRALAVDPNNIDALIWLSSYCGYLGKTDAALSFVGRLSKIEPLHFSGLTLLGHVQIMGGRLGPALDSLGRACESFPGYLLPRWFYAFALACDHQIDKAYSIFNKLAEEAPDDKLDKLGLSLALALRHEKSEALLILQGLHWQAWAYDNFAYSFYIAECYSLLDEKDQALDWLENSVNRGMINYPYLSQHDCFLANIRSEPRFQKLMQRVKYEWEHFEV